MLSQTRYAVAFSVAISVAVAIVNEGRKIVQFDRVGKVLRGHQAASANARRLEMAQRTNDLSSNHAIAQQIQVLQLGQPRTPFVRNRFAQEMQSRQSGQGSFHRC